MGIHSVLDRPAPSTDAEAPTPLTTDASTAIGLASRAEWRAREHVALHGLWDADVESALADEARRSRLRASGPAAGPAQRTASGRPGDRSTLIASGPVLQQLHLELAGLARRLTGQALVPTFAAYYYYQDDDEVRLHLDTEDCDLTMITEALGPLGPLHLHPELVGRTTEELTALEADPTWDRWSGLPITHPRRGVTAFRGRRIPHHRPGCLLDGLGAVAALHYRTRY